MRSKFSIMGHPLHPTLVAIPVGLFGWALLSDIVYLAGGRNHMWYEIAFWTGIAAFLSALVAALPGFGDFFTMALNSSARGIATAHMLFNLTTVALYFVAMLLMLDDNAVDRASYIVVLILHAIGFGILGLSGWLGGKWSTSIISRSYRTTRELARAEIAHHDLRTGLQKR